jgi:hypothetical protein
LKNNPEHAEIASAMGAILFSMRQFRAQWNGEKQLGKTGIDTVADQAIRVQGETVVPDAFRTLLAQCGEGELDADFVSEVLYDWGFSALTPIGSEEKKVFCEAVQRWIAGEE